MLAADRVTHGRRRPSVWLLFSFGWNWKCREKNKSGPAKLKLAKRNRVQKTYAGLVYIISGAKLHIPRGLVWRQDLSVRRPAKKNTKTNIPSGKEEMLLVLFFGPFLVALIYVYMCSGLADVIYDFQAVIGSVPAGRWSGKTTQKTTTYLSLLIRKSRLAEESLRDFFLFLYFFFR
jgi:hypothetical protein